MVILITADGKTYFPAEMTRIIAQSKAGSLNMDIIHFHLVIGDELEGFKSQYAINLDVWRRIVGPEHMRDKLLIY